MVSSNIEIVMMGVMFLVGVFAGIETNRAVQRVVLEWRSTGRHAAPSQEQRRSSLIAVISGVFFGMFILPRLPVHFSTLIFLPFGTGLALTILISLVQKFVPGSPNG